MRYKLIILDIDGTITRHISSWRYIHEKLGLWKERAFQYEKAFFAGKINYRKFCELDAAHWRGMDAAKLRRVFNGVKYSKNAVRSIIELKRLGFKIAAISTGLQFIPERLKKELGIDYCVYNSLRTYRGKITGGVKINLAHGAKHKALSKIFFRFGVKPHETIAVGDSEGDVPLARNTGYSIAFNCTSRELARIADYNCRTKDFREVYRKIVEVNDK